MRLRIIDKDKVEFFKNGNFSNVRKLVSSKRLEMIQSGIYSKRYENHKFDLYSQFNFIDGLFDNLCGFGDTNDIRVLYQVLKQEQFDSDALDYDVMHARKNGISHIGKVVSVPLFERIHDYVYDIKCLLSTLCFSMYMPRFEYENYHFCYQHIVKNEFCFDIGFRFYYWPFYKQKLQNQRTSSELHRNINDHGGYDMNYETTVYNCKI